MCVGGGRAACLCGQYGSVSGVPGRVRGDRFGGYIGSVGRRAGDPSPASAPAIWVSHWTVLLVTDM